MSRDCLTRSRARLVKRTAVLFTLVAAAILPLISPVPVLGYDAIQNRAEHTENRVVPVPGEVTINGDLSDWDLSGAIRMSLTDASEETHSVRAAMMYGERYLYVGGRRRDPTPMNNRTAFDGRVGRAWKVLT